MLLTLTLATGPIAMQPTSDRVSTYLQDLSVQYTTAHGLPDAPVQTLAIAGEALYAGTAQGVYRASLQKPDRWQKVADRWHMWTQRRPRLRVRQPREDAFTDDDESEEDEAFEKLQREVDRILDKIAREGTESLTRQERRTMQRASQLFRERLSGKR